MDSSLAAFADRASPELISVLGRQSGATLPLHLLSVACSGASLAAARATRLTAEAEVHRSATRRRCSVNARATSSIRKARLRPSMPRDQVLTPTGEAVAEDVVVAVEVGVTVAVEVGVAVAVTTGV